MPGRTYLESRGFFPGRAAVKNVMRGNQHKEENSNMRRKRLAGLMVCVMLFSLFPANALAAEGGGIPVNRAVSLPAPET